MMIQQLEVPKSRMNISSKMLPELRHETAGDTCTIEITGTIKNVSQDGKYNIYSIEIDKAKYKDKSDQDEGMKSALKEAKHIKLNSRPASYA